MHCSGFRTGFSYRAAWVICGLFVVCAVANGPARAGTTKGTWKQLVNPNPQFANGTMVLLTDGTVMVESGNDSQSWTKLTPDSKGSYVNGTWSNVAKMGRARLYFGSNVLPDGRLFVIGGEYSGPFLNQNVTNTGEIYDPTTNRWTAITPFPEASFGDDPTVVLPFGYILCGSLFTSNTYLYDPVFDFWFQAGIKLRNDRSDEETWLMLPDGSILSYDVFASDTNQVGSAQRFDSFSFTWVDAGTVPVIMSSAAVGFEFGPGAVLPNGKVIFIGGNEKTAIYTPPTTSSGTGSWVAGPTLPLGMGSDDAPGAILPDGHFIFLADTTTFNSPAHLFDYDYTTNTITDITSTLPVQLQNELFFSSAFTCRMLLIPEGGLLLTTGSDTMWEYIPSGAPQASWKPTITSISKINSHHFQILGSRLTGISEGATYGDDVESATNYPIVRFEQPNLVRYARTTNWTPGISSPGDTSLQTVEFDTPPNLAPGTYYVSVIANGIKSVNTTMVFKPSHVSASFTNGSLNITGDTDDNNLTVTYKQVKVSGVLKSASVTVAGNDAYTTINGLPSVTFDVGINRFTVNAQMGAGNDSVTFNSLFLNGMVCNLGDGDDTLSLFYNSIANQLTVDGGAGIDTVTLTGNSIIKKTLTNVP